MHCSWSSAVSVPGCSRTAAYICRHAHPPASEESRECVVGGARVSSVNRAWIGLRHCAQVPRRQREESQWACPPAESPSDSDEPTVHDDSEWTTDAAPSPSVAAAPSHTPEDDSSADAEALPVPILPRPMDMSRPAEPKPLWLTIGLSPGLDSCFANLRQFNDLKRTAAVEKVLLLGACVQTHARVCESGCVRCAGAFGVADNRRRAANHRSNSAPPHHSTLRRDWLWQEYSGTAHRRGSCAVSAEWHCLRVLHAVRSVSRADHAVGRHARSAYRRRRRYRSSCTRMGTRMLRGCRA